MSTATQPTQQEKYIPHPFIPGARPVPAAWANPELAGMARGMTASGLYLGGAITTLVSVVPWALQSQPYAHSNAEGRPAGRCIYSFPAASFNVRGGENTYSKLTLHDKFMMLQNTAADPDAEKAEYVPRAMKMLNPDINTGFAHDLVREFTGDHYGNKRGRLGVGIIIGQRPWMPDNEPTQDELEALRKLQLNFFLGLVETADAAWISGQPKERARIGQEHRRALECCGEDPVGHEWYIPMGVTNSKVFDCPACGSQVFSSFFKCKGCQLDVADFYLERGMKPDPKVMPGVSSEVEYRLKKKKPS